MPPDHDRWPSFFLGGFESSTHRLRSGRRLDLADSTRHRRFAEQDYDRLVGLGIHGAREGLAWHLIERGDRCDFSSALPMIRAARRTGVRIIWDLMHFGWPDDLDIFAPAFVTRFGAFAQAFAAFLAAETDAAPWITPVNEISFLSWAGGDVAAFNPFCTGRGFELKCQLVRAALGATEAIRRVFPQAVVFVHEPAFHVMPHPDAPWDAMRTEETRLTQFQAVDLLLGRLWPQLGGNDSAVDVIGVNYYPWNQWTHASALQPSDLVRRGDPRYRPLADILCEWHARYGRPVYLGETGCEDDERASWLCYASDAVHDARARGAVVEGLCLYPIVNFPGWDDDRHCRNGLWDYADDDGDRPLDAAFHAELGRQQRRVALARC